MSPFHGRSLWSAARQGQPRRPGARTTVPARKNLIIFLQSPSTIASKPRKAGCVPKDDSFSGRGERREERGREAERAQREARTRAGERGIEPQSACTRPPVQPPPAASRARPPAPARAGFGSDSDPVSCNFSCLKICEFSIHKRPFSKVISASVTGPGVRSRSTCKCARATTRRRCALHAAPLSFSQRALSNELNHDGFHPLLRPRLPPHPHLNDAAGRTRGGRKGAGARAGTEKVYTRMRRSLHALR